VLRHDPEHRVQHLPLHVAVKENLLELRQRDGRERGVGGARDEAAVHDVEKAPHKLRQQLVVLPSHCELFELRRARLGANRRQHAVAQVVRYRSDVLLVQHLRAARRALLDSHINRVRRGKESVGKPLAPPPRPRVLILQDVLHDVDRPLHRLPRIIDVHIRRARNIFGKLQVPASSEAARAAGGWGRAVSRRSAHCARGAFVSSGRARRTSSSGRRRARPARSASACA
jgi:hypothetical protein